MNGNDSKKGAVSKSAAKRIDLGIAGLAAIILAVSVGLAACGTGPSERQAAQELTDESSRPATECGTVASFAPEKLSGLLDERNRAWEDALSQVQKVSANISVLAASVGEVTDAYEELGCEAEDRTSAQKAECRRHREKVRVLVEDMAFLRAKQSRLLAEAYDEREEFNERLLDEHSGCQEPGLRDQTSVGLPESGAGTGVAALYESLQRRFDPRAEAGDFRSTDGARGSDGNYREIGRKLRSLADEYERLRSCIESGECGPTSERSD